VRVILFAAHQEDDLNQCDQTGAGHDAVRNVERIDVNAPDRRFLLFRLFLPEKIYL
jgi:hypothetical protein